MTLLVRTRVLGIFFVAIALGSLVGASGARADSRQFGDLALTNLEGEKVSLGDLRGNVVVLNFWATWCKPCVEEMPLLARMAERFHARGLQLVAASVDEAENRETVERFAGRMPKGMVVWIGATLADMQRLGVGESLPVTVLLDREGRVARVHRGAIEDSSFDDLIEALLGGSPEKKKFPGVTEASAPQREGPSL